jgi:uncharacterized protein DUF1064
MKRHKKSKSPSVKSENKKIRNAKMMELADGTKFRSKLELFTYQKLLEAGIKDFKYEVDKFVLQEAFEFPNESIELYETNRKNEKGNKVKLTYFDKVDPKIRRMTYLPDFTRIGEDKKGWVLEVKGYATDQFDLKWKLFKKHLIDNGYDVTLYKPNNQGNVIKCIEMIKTKYYG